MAFTVLEGEITRIFDTQITGSFEYREFWLEEIAQFASMWPVRAIHGGTSVLDSFKVGDKVQVIAQVKGRKWEKEGRETCFMSLEMARIMPWQDVRAKGASQPAQTAPSNSATNPPPPPSAATEPADDLPF